MPIYAYKCNACGHTAEVLQKISDAPLVICPSCGRSTFDKQLTAAGFQLKGSGWYVTDFRGGNTAKTPDAARSENSSGAEKSQDASSPSASSATGPAVDTKANSNSSPPATAV